MRTPVQTIAINGKTKLNRSLRQNFYCEQQKTYSTLTSIYFYGRFTKFAYTAFDEEVF